MNFRISNSALIFVVVIMVIATVLVYEKFFDEPIYPEPTISSTGEVSDLIIEKVKRVELGQSKVFASLAITPQARLIGLSGKSELPSDHGMLFVFDRPGIYGMWMKNMRFSIDIVWIGENFDIVHIEKDLSPGTFPETFESKTNALYVLKLPSGYVDAHNIAVGQSVKFLTE